MIIYKKVPFDCLMKNVILLDDKFSNGCVYVDLNTYNQAHTLSVVYSENTDRILTTIQGNIQWRMNAPLTAVVNKACEKMPKPLNMLAPFLIYLNDIQQIEWKTNDEELCEQVYGYLHQISTMIDFYATTTVSSEIRAKLVIPYNILNNYNVAWDILTNGLDKNVVEIENQKVPVTDMLSEVVDKLSDIVDKFNTVEAQPVRVVNEQTSNVMNSSKIEPVAEQPKEENKDNAEDEIPEWLRKIQDEMEEEEKEEAERDRKREEERAAQRAAKEKGETPTTTSSSISDDKDKSEKEKREEAIATNSVNILNSYDI